LDEKNYQFIHFSNVKDSTILYKKKKKCYPPSPYPDSFQISSGREKAGAAASAKLFSGCHIVPNFKESLWVCQPGTKFLQPTLILRFNSKIIHHKRPYISIFIYYLRSRFSSSVSCFGFYANQHRISTKLFRLQLSCKFKRVCRYNPVVVIGCSDKCCRVTDTLFYIVNREYL